MKDLLDTLDAWRGEGTGIGRAIVVRTFGSAPRPEGAVLLVSDDGRLAGSVSGGCVEGAAAEEIARARRDGRSRVIRYGISDEQAWDVGLACGGTIDVLVEPRVPEPAVAAARDTSTGRTGGRAVITELPPDAPPPEFGQHQPGDGTEPGTPWVVGDDPSHPEELPVDAETAATLVDAARDALLRGSSRTVQVRDRQFFIEAYPMRPRLVVVGAVEVARTLVRLARDLGFETVVIDGRAAFATPERFPEVDRLVVGWPDEVAEEIGLGPADSVAVLTHDVKFDEPAIVEALRRGCRYVGAVGSKKTQADRRARLREAGVTDEELDRLRGPIGLDLGGRAPAETALAILAEVVAERYGGSGTPMRELAGRVRFVPEPAPITAGSPGVSRRVLAVVLAAGRATRFGSTKVLAPLEGRPILEHVLDRVIAGGVDGAVVVLGQDAAVEDRVSWPAGVRRVVNPDPSRGLASSLAIGVAAARTAGPAPDAILVALGDQPRVRPEVIGALLAMLDDPRPLKVPRYADEANPNPVLLAPDAYDLVRETTGDRGLGPLIARHPELVHELAVPGRNADVDTPEDLASLEGVGAETDDRPLRHPVR